MNHDILTIGVPVIAIFLAALLNRSDVQRLEDRINKRFDTMEQSIQRRFDTVEQRFNAMEARFDSIHRDFGEFHNTLVNTEPGSIA